MRGRAFLFWLAALLPPALSAGLPVLSESQQPFSFVVLGDLHVSRPQFESRKVVQAVAEACRAAQPPVALVCQTGDLAHGEGEEHRQLDAAGVAEELAFAVTCVTQAFGAPLFVAVGNHDKHGGGAAFRETVLPLVSRQLGATVDTSYYAFRYGSACFIFLDYGDYARRGGSMDYAAQRRFLEEALAQARAEPAVRRVFAFSHYPLWAAVRPGFSSDRFTESVLPALAGAPVDAFFCGHTHNSGAWVRRVGGARVTQIMGVALDRSSPLRPMEESRTLLIPREELSYGWGYLSGPPNGFYLVSVEGPRVRVQFRSGKEVVREFEWQEPGHVADAVAPPRTPPTEVQEAELRQAVSATLAFTPWAAQRADLAVRLNGELAGDVRLEPMPHWAAFASEARVRLSPAALKGLRLVNTVSFENPGKALFGIGSLRLEVRLASGAAARTAVFERFLLSAERSEAEAGGASALGWEIVPAGVCSEVRLGQPLGPAQLRFPGRGTPLER